MAVDAALAPYLPFASYEFVTVTFDAQISPVRIPHGLLPEDPYAVRYLPIWKSRECVIADARVEDGAYTEPWSRSYIVLQSNLAPVTVELLLFVPRRAR